VKAENAMSDRFRSNLRKIRTRQKLSQAQLARIMGISHNYLQQLETGGRSPSRNVLMLACAALRVDMNDLLKEDK
jgi:transcriptional regulator with XRE-family HTH domain